MENLTSIYKIQNKITNYIYVGSTNKTLEERFRQHCKRARELQETSLFYKDIIHYGAENFTIELLDTCFERHRFIIEEHWYLKLYDEHYLMYDIKQGSKHSANTKQKLAELANKPERVAIYKEQEFKYKMSKKTSGELNGMYGKKGNNAVNGRMVIAYLDKEKSQIFKIFPSVGEALKFLGVKGHTKLNEACKNNIEYYGYYWDKQWINR